MAIGAKRIEARPRTWKHRGPVVIHAGLSTKWLPFCAIEPFRSVLKGAAHDGPSDLPFGEVLAVGNMINCIAMRPDADDPSIVTVPGYDQMLTSQK